MAFMATVRKQCAESTCTEEKDTCDCNGCSTTFCHHHYEEHREALIKIFNQLQDDFNSFRQRLCDRKKDDQILELDQWEKESITKIQQIAQEYRDQSIKYKDKFIIETENQLTIIATHLKQNEKQKQINEIELNQMKEKLHSLQNELDKIPKILIKQESTSSETKISLDIPFYKDMTKTSKFLQVVIHSEEKNVKWKADGITVAGGHGQGSELNQLWYPRCICMDNDQTIYVADYENDRIVKWTSNANNGQIVAGGNGKGDQMNQFNDPSNIIIDKETNTFIIADWKNRRVMRWSRQNNTINGDIIISNIDGWGLTMDNNGSIYISDTEKNEVRRLKKNENGQGTIVAGGNGKGDQLNQLNWPTAIFIDDDYSLYICDCYNHRVIKWIKDAYEGIVVAGGNDQGNSLSQLSKPQGVVVDQFGRIYVADTYNHRIMCWCHGATEGVIVVVEMEKEDNQLNFKVLLGCHLIGKGIFMLWIIEIIESKNLKLFTINKREIGQLHFSVTIYCLVFVSLKIVE